MKSKKKLPIGIQAFQELIRGNYCYIDKTREIYTLIQEGKFYFCSRPRRFGKSLFLSTMKNLFEGKRELFSNLWIDQSDYEWGEYPTLLLDLSAINNTTPQELSAHLEEYFYKVADTHGITLRSAFFKGKFTELIEKLAKKNKVVILIDEYDRPIIDHLDNHAVAKGNRDVLRDFFTLFKSLDEHIRFVFITGVSKLSHLSLFSGANNLKDISLYDRFSTLMGYTEKEITVHFMKEMDQFSKERALSYEEVMALMKFWYNGYRFSKLGEAVYNPFSTLLFLDMQDIGAHWFKTATPKMLFDLLEKKPEALTTLNHTLALPSVFDASTIESINLISMMWQTGYLTIKSWKDPHFTLGYPNEEVRSAFEEHLFQYFVGGEHPSLSSFAGKVVASLQKKKLSIFWSQMRTFFASIPYHLHEHKSERSYQLMCFLIVKSLGIEAATEVQTSRGRIDLTVHTKNTIYLFEFKINETPEAALEQIVEKKYYEQFFYQNKIILLQGVNFDTRNVESSSDQGRTLSFTDPIVYSSEGEILAIDKAGIS